MKLLIASDIHGCASSARKLVEYFEKEKCDKMLLLGDILYHGPRNNLPDEYDCKEVIALLNPLKEKIWCVRGNCDAEVDQMVLEFPLTSEYMQIPVEEKTIFATHGHHYGPDKLPPIGSGDILLCGHFHVPAHKQIEDVLYLNPGSTSIPKGGSEKSFMILDGRTLTWRRIEDGSVYDTVEL